MFIKLTTQDGSVIHANPMAVRSIEVTDEGSIVNYTNGASDTAIEDADALISQIGKAPKDKP